MLEITDANDGTIKKYLAQEAHLLEFKKRIVS
jgi:hypothetical protein